jgi:hypothetical protein
MRKSILDPTEQIPADTAPWLDLERLARVEVTSEDDLFPIENALAQRITTGWRASTTGPQTIRLLFDQPVSVRRLEIHIVERAAERTQEFAVYAGPSIDDLREVVRQQFTFSPGGSTEEIEQYTVTLDAVRVLDLRLDPDRAHHASDSINYASLVALRIA